MYDEKIAIMLYENLDYVIGDMLETIVEKAFDDVLLKDIDKACYDFSKNILTVVDDE